MRNKSQSQWHRVNSQYMHHCIIRVNYREENRQLEGIPTNLFFTPVIKLFLPHFRAKIIKTDKAPLFTYSKLRTCFQRTNTHGCIYFLHSRYLSQFPRCLNMNTDANNKYYQTWVFFFVLSYLSIISVAISRLFISLS